MKYSKTAITVLNKMYRSVLLKCALINAVILSGVAVAQAAPTPTVTGLGGTQTSTYTFGTPVAGAASSANSVTYWDAASKSFKNVPINMISGSSVNNTYTLTPSSNGDIELFGQKYTVSPVSGAQNQIPTASQSGQRNLYQGQITATPVTTGNYIGGQSYYVDFIRDDITNPVMKMTTTNNTPVNLYTNFIKTRNYVGNQMKSDLSAEGNFNVYGDFISNDVYIYPRDETEHIGAFMSNIDGTSLNYSGDIIGNTIRMTNAASNSVGIAALQNSTFKSIVANNEINIEHSSADNVSDGIMRMANGTISDSLFSGNNVTIDQGSLNSSLVTGAGNVTISNSDFVNNSASNNITGAVYQNGGNLTVTDSNFIANEAQTANAIYAHSANVAINAQSKNVLIQNNDEGNADLYGIYMDDASKTLSFDAASNRTLTVDDKIYAPQQTDININTKTGSTGTVKLLNVSDNADVTIAKGVLNITGNSNQNIHNLNADGGKLSMANGHINTINIDTLSKSGSTSDMKLGLDYSGSNNTIDTLNIGTSGAAGVKVTLDSVNVTSDHVFGTPIPDVTYVYGADKLAANTLQDATVVSTNITSGGYRYTFTTKGDYNEQLGVEMSNGYILPQVVQLPEYNSYNNYSITTDNYKPLINDEGFNTELGILNGTGRKLTLYGNGRSMSGVMPNGNKGNGITVKSGQTFTVNNVNGYSNFTTGIINQSGGIVNVSGSTFSNNDNDINNNGTLNLSTGANNLNDITGTGTTNVKSGHVTITSTSNDAVTQGNLAVSSGATLTAHANAFNITAASGINNSGTVELDSGTLDTKIINGSIKIIGNVTTNADNLGGATGNAASTLTLTGGKVGKAISGNGNTIIAGTVNNTQKISNNIVVNNGAALTSTYANASKITNNGTFNLSGNLTGNVGGTGTTVFQSSTTSITGSPTITGTLDMNGKTVKMHNTAYQTLTVGKLSGTGNLSIDVDMRNVDNHAANSDKIHVSGSDNNAANLNLNSINILSNSGVTVGNYNDYVTYVDGNTNGINFTLGSSASTITSEGYRYNFSLGSAGKLNTNINTVSTTFPQFIRGENLNEPELATTYSFTSDVQLAEDIGTTHRDGDSPDTLYVHLNDHTLSAQTDASDNPQYNGLIVNSGYTVNVDSTNSGNINGFTTAITVMESDVDGVNDGVLNLKNVVLDDNGTDIANGGQVNFSGNNSLNNMTGNGSSNVTGGKLTVTSNADDAITQGSLTVSSGATLTTAANALNIASGITNSGTVELTEGTLDNKINGGNIKISGDVTTNANNLGGVTNNAASDLTLTGGTVSKAINGTGTTVVDGNVTAHAQITNAVEITRNNTLNSNANYIVGDVDSNGTYNVTGGTLSNTVTGGNTNINGDVTYGSTADLSGTSTHILQGKSLDVASNNAKIGQTTVDGTLKMDITNATNHSSVYEGGKVTVSSLDIGPTGLFSVNVASGLLTEQHAETAGLTLIGNSAGAPITPIFTNIETTYNYEITGNPDGTYTLRNRDSYADTSAASRWGNANNRSTAEGWDNATTLAEGTTAREVQKYLNRISHSDGRAYVDALNAIAPSDAIVHVAMTQDYNNSIEEQLLKRLGDDEQGMSSGDPFERYRAWVQALYIHSKEDDDFEHQGFTGKTNGLAMGVDGFIDNRTVVGIGYAFHDSDVDVNARDIGIGSHTIFAYGRYQPSEWYVRGMINYGNAKYEENVSVAGFANEAHYHVQNFGARAYVGYDMPNGVTPEAGVRMTHIKRDTYNDDFGQRIKTKDVDVMTVVAGARYQANLTTDGITWTPKAKAALTYDVVSDDSNSAVAIGNMVYGIKAHRLNRLGAEVGIGAEVNVDDWDLSAGYNLGIRKDYLEHTGYLKAKYNF